MLMHYLLSLLTFVVLSTYLDLSITRITTINESDRDNFTEQDAKPDEQLAKR